MHHSYYYCKETRCWWGYWSDNQGNQLGEAINDYHKDYLLIHLGVIKEDRRALIK